jgi:APA family basic amino acid/polyamine antiporter
MGYVIIFVIANIIGSGVYKKIAPMAAELHSSVWILAAWIVGGIITLFGALSNAEVAGLLADTGGEFIYLKKIYNRFFSFIYGWSLFTVIQTATISSLAYVFAQSLNSIITIPAIFSSLQHFTIGGIFYPFQDFGVKLTAILLILILTGLNISGLKSGAGISRAIMLLVFTGLLTIVIFGLGSISTIPSNFMDVKAELLRFLPFSRLCWLPSGLTRDGFLSDLSEVKLKIPHEIFREELLRVLLL